jgi:hypothetical protein
VQEIEQLKREGLSIKAISKLTGWDRKTLRKYLIKPHRLTARESRGQANWMDSNHASKSD